MNRNFNWSGKSYASRKFLAAAFNALIVIMGVQLVGPPTRVEAQVPAKFAIVAGSISECGVGLHNGWISRRITVDLRKSKSNRLIARYTVQPEDRVGSYAFNVSPGRYVIVLSGSRSAAILVKAGRIVNHDIATTCQ